jgi:hypothetical protein
MSDARIVSNLPKWTSPTVIDAMFMKVWPDIGCPHALECANPVSVTSKSACTKWEDWDGDTGMLVNSIEVWKTKLVTFSLLLIVGHLCFPV